jgi:hypothetical protein
VYKLITSVLSKRYWLIHRKNSYAPGGKQRTACREKQSRELVKLLKADPV